MKIKEDLSNRSDEDLIKERTSLIEEYRLKVKRCGEINSRLSIIKQELRKRRTDRNIPFVSDHAVIRYLERVYGLKVEDIKEHIESKIPLDFEVSEHNGIVVENFILKLSQDKKAVATVISKDMTDKGILNENQN